MGLDFRLNILKEAGQLSENGYRIINDIIKIFYTKWDIRLDEENGAMLITHLVTALKRIENNESVDKLDGFLMQQLYGSRYYAEAEKILGELNKLLVFPENERGYILLHLCTLLEKEG